MRLLSGIVVASLVASSAAAQTHIAGVIGGLSINGGRLRSGLPDPFLPDIGVTSTIEFNRFFSVGTEARLVRKDRSPVTLDYLETPLFVRFSDSGTPDHPVKLFARFGIAPAIEVSCNYDRNRDANPQGANSPDTRRVVADPVGFKYHPPPKPRDMTEYTECIRARQRKLDIGWLSGLGVTIRDRRKEYGIELRVTKGARDLSNDLEYFSQPFRNRALSLLLTSATRQF